MYATILLVLVGSITLVVQGGARYMRQGTEYQEAQRQTLMGLKLVTADIARSTTARRDPDAGTAAMANADYFIFLSPVPDDSSNPWTYNGEQLEYHAWICYYLTATPIGDLVRVRRPLPSAETSNNIGNPPPLADFQVNQPGDVRRVVSRGVTEFTLNDGTTGQQVRVNLGCSVNWEDTNADGVNDREIVTTISGQSLATMPNP